MTGSIKSLGINARRWSCEQMSSPNSTVFKIEISQKSVLAHLPENKSRLLIGTLVQ